MANGPFPQHVRDWIAARKRHHLSHAHVQMARELGLNPKKLGKIDNDDQEPWKAPGRHRCRSSSSISTGSGSAATGWRQLLLCSDDN
jgi:hypothetical protein